LALDTSIACIEAVGADVLDLYQAEPVLLPRPSGKGSARHEAYICAVRCTGGVRVYLALVGEHKKTFVYTATGAPQPEKEYQESLQEALEYSQSLGFAPERVNLNYSPAMREVVLRNIKILRAPGSKAQAQRQGAAAAATAKVAPPAKGDRSAAAAPEAPELPLDLLEPDAVPDPAESPADAFLAAGALAAGLALATAPAPDSDTLAAQAARQQEELAGWQLRYEALQQQAARESAAREEKLAQARLAQAEAAALSRQLQEERDALLHDRSDSEQREREEAAAAEREELEAAAAARGELAAQLADSESRARHLAGELEAALQGHENQVREAQLMAQRVVELEEERDRQLEQVRAELDAARLQGDQAVERHTAAAGELAKVLAALTEQRRETEQLRMERDRAIEQQQLLEATRHSDQADEAEDRAVVDAALAERDAALDQLETLTRERDAALAKVQKLQRQLAQQEGRSRTQQDELARAAAERDAADAARAQLEQEHAALAQEHAALQQEHAELQLGHDALLREQRALRQERTELAAELAAARAAAAAAEPVAEPAPVAGFPDRSDRTQAAELPAPELPPWSAALAAAADPDPFAGTGHDSGWQGELQPSDPALQQRHSSVAADWYHTDACVPEPADFSGSDDFFPSDDGDGDGPGRFLLQPSRTGILYHSVAELVELHCSVNVAQLSPDGKAPVTCQGYICGLESSGQRAVRVALYAPQDGRCWVYEPEQQPSDPAQWQRTIAAAVEFAEGVGFLMERVSFSAPAEAARNCPVLREAA